jgi:hypothetical protein
MSFGRARAIADAVLYEGYLLYPYRASSRKNQVRWQFGVVGPAGAAADGVGEDSTMVTECLLETGQAASVDVRLRFLQLQARTVERADGPGPDAAFVPVPELTSGTQTWLPWDEAVEHEINVGDMLPTALLAEPRSVPVEVPGSEEVELLHDGDGTVIGRLRRRQWPISGRLEISCSDVSGRTPVFAVRVELANACQWTSGGNRDEALRHSFIGAHLLLAVRDGAFVSLTDPPEWARSAAKACTNVRCWPVLVGAEGERDVLLAAPIILSDWPEIAAESPGELFDSTEIDEILTLRVMTMTEEEKREARATDPRAGAILDRCDGMTPEVFERLHGAIHGLPSIPEPPTDSTPGWLPTPVPDPDVPWWDPGADASVAPETDAVDVKGVAVAKGSRVRLCPSRRADAQDLFFSEQTATVAGVHHDVDGNVHVAVVLDDDPAKDMHEWYGRYLYFGPEELEPLEVAR